MWAAEEYLLLPRYDRTTPNQPHGVFLCHQQDGRVCAGWCGCHDMDESLGLRMAQSFGLITLDVADAIREYVSPVPLFVTGAEACRHGLKDLENPGPDALKLVAKITGRRGDGTG